LGVAPNFLINNRFDSIPMAIEESSVVAAAAKAAQFWMDRGGFRAEVLSSTKIGHVHFLFHGNSHDLHAAFPNLQPKLLEDTDRLTANMQARGGGILSTRLVDKSADLANYFQLEVRFETKDSMGANFINSCLEQMAKTLKTHCSGRIRCKIFSGSTHRGN
jgi:hydroxymethylglutaryl-CoA reductase